MSTILTNAYLDYTNNYLTIEKYAEHNGLSILQAETILSVGHDLFENGDFLNDR